MMEELQKYILNRSDPVTESGCWIWMGCTNHKGYGKFYRKGKGWLSHRASWAAFKGSIPDNKRVLHRCDVPQCVNPDHLWIGTDADNVKDMILKGRNRPLKGQQHGMAKLSEADVLEIRRRIKLGDKKLRIAKDYPVSRQVIIAIGARKIWRCVE